MKEIEARASIRINTVIIVGIVNAKYNRCSNYQNAPCGKAVEMDRIEQEEGEVTGSMVKWKYNIAMVDNFESDTSETDDGNENDCLCLTFVIQQ